MDKNCKVAETSLHSFLEYIYANPRMAWFLVASIVFLLVFILYIIYRRGLSIGKKVVIPSRNEREDCTKLVEESRFHQRPDFIQKVSDDYCWFYAHKGAMIKFGGATWNHEDHYQALDLFQSLLINDSIDSIEFIDSSIPSRVLTALEKKLTKFKETEKIFTIYCSSQQKNYLENNLSLYDNKKIVEI